MTKSIIQLLSEKREQIVSLFLKQNSKIEIIDRNEQVNNFVYQVNFQGVKAYLKIGFASTLSPEIDFYKLSPKFQKFDVPQLLESGFIDTAGIFSDKNVELASADISDEKIMFAITKKIVGNKLSQCANSSIKKVNNDIITITKEIDYISAIDYAKPSYSVKLSLSEEVLKILIAKQEGFLLDWHTKSSIKYDSLYNLALEILHSLSVEKPFEIGVSHGELNFNHIFINNSNKLSLDKPYTIIDWGKISLTRFRYFDFAEYISRILIEKDMFTDFKILLSEFVTNFDFNRITFIYTLIHRIIGTLYEVTYSCKNNIKPSFTEKELLDIINNIK